MEQNSIGVFINALRKSRGMTQKDLAERIGVSDKSVSRWERGDGLPDLSLIPVIAEIFEVTCDELLTGKKVATPEAVPSPSKSTQQVKRLVADATFQMKLGVVIASFLAITAILIPITTDFATSPGLILLLLSLEVLWVFYSRFHQKMGSNLLTVDHRLEIWSAILPTLMGYSLVLTLSLGYLSLWSFFGYGFLPLYQFLVTTDSVAVAVMLEGLVFINSHLNLMWSTFFFALLWVVLLRPRFDLIIIRKNLVSPETASRIKSRAKTLSIVNWSYLAVLIITIACQIVLNIIPATTLFSEGISFDDLTSLQEYLDESMPFFPEGYREEQERYIENHTIVFTDFMGDPILEYQLYSNSKEVVFSPFTTFPATVYTSAQCVAATEVRDTVSAGVTLLFPVELMIWIGFYAKFAWKPREGQRYSDTVAE